MDLDMSMDLTPVPFCMGSTEEEGKKSTGVFWDLSDYPIPDHLDPARVVENIKSVLKESGYPGEVYVWAYLPGGKTFSKHSVQEYKDAGITTISVMEDKYRRLNRMILDFLVWSLDNDPHCRVGPNILVITKDIFGKKTTFLPVLRSLEISYYHVLLALPDDDHTTEPPPSWVKSKWHWRILSGGGGGGGDPPINETESSPKCW